MNSVDINTQATILINLIRKELENVSFQEVCEFNLKDWESKIKEDELKFGGIYLFEINKEYSNISYQNWLEKFKEKWENDEIKKSALIYQNRFEILLYNEPEDKWLPFYIGKSENVFKRIKEHITKDKNSSTSALKLNSRKSVEASSFRLKVLRVEVDKENYNLILTEIEKRLREKHNPLVGKQ